MQERSVKAPCLDGDVASTAAVDGACNASSLPEGSATAQRRIYQAPQLRLHGSVRELTRNAGTGPLDAIEGPSAT